jgi:ornithine cyclodeaminase/alanine dehydrogenase-like protein (mu-crystallin family)
MNTLLVNPSEIRGIVTMAEAVEAVRLGFREWGENAALNAPRRRIHIPTGVRVSVHQGGVPAAKATGLMTHCEWVKPMAEEQVYPRLNHPVIVLYDSAEGELKGIIVGEITCSELPNNIAVTGLRTAATSAVGTDLLARPDANSLGIFGAAGQAKNHLLALMQVRKLKDVKVYSRNPANRRKFADEMGPVTNLTGRVPTRCRARRRYRFDRDQFQRARVRWELAAARSACDDYCRQQRRPGQRRLYRR